MLNSTKTDGWMPNQKTGGQWLLVMVLTLSFQQSVLAQPMLAGPGGQGVSQGQLVLPQGEQLYQNQPVLQVQASSEEKDDKPLPSEIEAMPKIEQEMEIIHRRSQLVIARAAISRMAIADPGVVDVVQYSPTEIGVIGASMGSTTLTIWFRDNKDPLIYLVRVIRDPSGEEQRRLDYGKLERKIALLFPNSKVYLIPFSQKIIVKGQARDSEEAAQILNLVRGEAVNQFGDLNGPQPGGFGGAFGGFGNNNGIGLNDVFSSFIVNMLEVPGEQQVMLKVRIAELKRSQLRRMGVDLTYLVNGGRHVLASTLGAAGLGANLSGVFEAGEINVLMAWLTTNSTAKILSEPTLTVLSGHPASFLAGGEFAVPTIVGVGGAQGTSTTFRGFGTSVLVTPTIIDRDLIRMNITPEFSQIDPSSSVGGVPGLASRRVQTTVQLREGQTIVLAGLLSRQQSTEVGRVPYLASLPVIGPRVFAAKRATEDETELLVLVTPEIVRPMDADEVPPMPGFNVTHPTDEDLWHRAQTEGAPDNGVYQLAPYGRGTGTGMEVGYRLHEPQPAEPMYAPMPTGAFQGMTTESQFGGGRYGGAMGMDQGYVPGSSMMSSPMMSSPQMSSPMMQYPSQPMMQYPSAPMSQPMMQPMMPHSTMPHSTMPQGGTPSYAPGPGTMPTPQPMMNHQMQGSQTRYRPSRPAVVQASETAPADSTSSRLRAFFRRGSGETESQPSNISPAGYSQPGVGQPAVSSGYAPQQYPAGTRSYR